MAGKHEVLKLVKSTTDGLYFLYLIVNDSEHYPIVKIDLNERVLVIGLQEKF